jgi:hypothetical protein
MGFPGFNVRNRRKIFMTKRFGTKQYIITTDLGDDSNLDLSNVEVNEEFHNLYSSPIIIRMIK